MSRVDALLGTATSRGAVKRLGAQVDADSLLRDEIIALARARGVDVVEEWNGKRLVRALLDRAAQAQVRTNPIVRDEAFVCAHCGAAVAPHGRTARDHCPKCLRGLHVDVIPGDRAADCGGVLEPIGVEVRGDVTLLRFRCRRCGADKRNLATLDGDSPDDWSAIVALSARG